MLSVIVPCYNEQEVIQETHSQLTQSLQNIGEDYEIVYVNDGSKDNTLKLLKELKTLDSKIVILDFSRNFGHQPAVAAGLANCRGDYAAIIDADLQDPPKYIPEMLQIAKNEGANVVYGVRKVREGESWFKKITAKMFYRLINYFSTVNMPIDTGDFRLIDRKIIDNFNQLKERHKYIRGLIAWLGFKQVPFYYNREARFAGETHYPFFKMVKFATNGLLYFSIKPLSIATNVGIFFVITSFIFLAINIYRRIMYPEELVSGWTSLMTAIVFFGGVQLVTIGVLGSYIGRIFEEVKERPEYIINEKY